MENNNEVLLKVEHLSQYFKLGKSKLKAVDDVSFDIKKGEVFGLVGESGCGKTTTGRSIIKLYDITSGNVIFKGRRVFAGTLSYKQAIANCKKESDEKLKVLKQRLKDNPDFSESIKEEISEVIKQRDSFIEEQLKEKRAAIHDHKHGDKIYAAEQVAELDKEYKEKLEAVKDNPAEYKKLLKKYKHDRNVANHSRFITQIQMIFQDPIASLDPRMTVREIISEGLVIKGIKDKEYIDNKVYEILETVGLVREHADRYPHEFSGGQRQRIGIARAVVKPTLLRISTVLMLRAKRRSPPPSRLIRSFPRMT